MKVGIDVGGTFTDFLVTDEDGGVQVGKVLTTPEDPSSGLLRGLEEMAGERGQSLAAFAGSISTIVHGTTVTTNVVLTRTGAKTGLLTGVTALSGFAELADGTQVAFSVIANGFRSSAERAMDAVDGFVSALTTASISAEQGAANAGDGRLP